MGKRRSTETVQAEMEWMLQSALPTPLAYFRFVNSSQKSSALRKYCNLLLKVTKESSDSAVVDKLNSLLDKFNVCV